MLKVMLIGDSIRLGYQDRVRQMLDGRAVLCAPEENCRFSAYTLFNLQPWMPDNDFDVVHWNNGQWDTCYMSDGRIHTPLATYLEIQKRIVEILRRKARRLVFATTTPVHADQYEKAAINGRKNVDIEAYNRAAVKELSALGVEINDIHAALAGSVTTYISEDKVHLSPAGVETCARLVVAAVTGSPR